MRRSALNRNHYFLLGFLLGLFLSLYIPENIWNMVQDDCLLQSAYNLNSEKFVEDFEPHLNLINKPLAAKKPIKNVIRPRYYSSELGIRQKLFIGIMTSQDNINTLATAINRTTAHLVDKIKFFINADNVKSNFKLKNIVGFTDIRENLRPFHILKYIADNYLEDYDYFLITTDTTYLDARNLMKTLYHLSITFDIYMGQPTNDYHKFNDLGMDSDRNYCDLNAGILISSSVIRKMRTNLDWCVRNAITNFHSINIGRCVKFSTKLIGCQDSFQGIKIDSYLFDNIKLYKDLKVLQNNGKFKNSSIIYPITNVDDFYILHAFFSRLHLDTLKNMSYKLEQKAYHITNGTINNNILQIRWPLGVPPACIPETRHDILTWHFINRTHIFMPNHQNSIEQLNRIESEDIDRIVNISLSYARRKYQNTKLNYQNIHTIYRRFDPIRGMDYHLHLNFFDSKSYSKITKSFYVVKPLGRVEIVPSPYVTESTRIAILLPTFEHQTTNAMDFVRHYEKICMANQDNTFLLLIFLYRAESSSKGDTDPFRNIKTLALDLSTKYKTDGSRIAWVSIRLPNQYSNIIKPADYMLNTIYAYNEILSIAVTDLSLPKIGLDSLVMLGSNSMIFKADFLNRIRMNTIQGFQIFSPIGFMMYPCKFANFCKECETCDVSQASGYFDKWNYDVTAFYSRDYVEARKILEQRVPIIRTDGEIETLINRPDKTINNIVDIFISAQLPIHILRGIEPNLRFGNAIKNFLMEIDRENIPKCPGHIKYTSSLNTDNVANPYNKSILNHDDNQKFNFENKCIHIAARKQIGDAIIRFEDRNQLSDKRN